MRIIIVLLTLLLTARAGAEPLRLTKGAITPGGLVLPPGGLYVPEQDWSKLDLELRRLQEAETRLGAENKSLRRVASGERGAVIFGIGLLGGLVIGAVGGIVIGVVVK